MLAEWLLPPAHLIALVLATWRLTDAILMDRVFGWLRAWLPAEPPTTAGYLIRCPRCVSVWTGAICTALWAVWPYALWPLALSWLYLWYASGHDDTRVL
jgi:hypothetical protein